MCVFVQSAVFLFIRASVLRLLLALVGERVDTVAKRE